MIEDRAEVHQATGMVSVRAGVSMAEALVLLRAHSYATEQPILKVAAEVLDGELTFVEAPEEEGG